jgi:hypothetical protein
MKHEINLVNCNKYFFFKKMTWRLAIAQACNPSYSGSRYWEDYGLRLVQAKSS